MRFGAGHAHTRHIKIQQLRATTFVFAQKKQKQVKKKNQKKKMNSEKNEPLRACCQSNTQTVLCISTRTARKQNHTKHKNSQREKAWLNPTKMKQKTLFKSREKGDLQTNIFFIVYLCMYIYIYLLLLYTTKEKVL